MFPENHWALPSQADLALFWHNQGETWSRDNANNAVSFVVDSDLQMTLPTFHRTPSGKGRIRCVALGPEAPQRGYIKDDITLEQWNAYQFRKMTGK